MGNYSMSLCGMIAHLFLSLNSILLWRYTPVCLSIYPIEEYFGCFQVWAIMNNVAVNIHVQIFVWTWISIHLNKITDLLLDHIVRLHFVLEEIVKLSSKVAVPFLRSHSSAWEFQLLRSPISICCGLYSEFWPF